ncbi:MAG: pantoate--beta-alanine ligase [Lewinellaceae bacterium]|nr:pantoate--beta-alanine ligase [Lewinellaceae bacterium]
MIIIIEKAEDMSRLADKAHKKNLTVGFIPTMGALHKGHIKLVKASKKQCDFTIVSIFVNPTQFNDKNDLQKYPRTLDKDIEMLFEPSTDIVFVPQEEEIYPYGVDFENDLDLGGKDLPLEGKFRPGHFKGVAQVVKRLLEIVKPTHLFMGLKDFQQVAVVQHIIDRYEIPTKLVPVSTMREKSGLAMSSRNARLSEEGKEKAATIYKVLSSIVRNYNKRPVNYLLDKGFQKLKETGFETEYLSVVDGHTLQEISDLNDTDYAVVCVATWLEGVRLIDNMIIKQP